MKHKIVSAAITLGFVGASILTATPAQALSTVTSGDPALVQATKTALGSRYHNSVSVAHVNLNTNTTKYAHFGASNTLEYEIGSLAKPFTGHLLAQAIERGEVTADQTVGSLLPTLASKPVGTVKLSELATHRSGLPSIPSSYDWQRSYMQYTFYGKDPYIFDVPTLLTHASNSYSSYNRGKYVYSNMGNSVLGHALAAAAGTTYKQLLQERMLTPLGLASTTLPETQANLAVNAPLGKSSSGKVMQAWTMNAYAPAGGIRSNTADMASFAKQLLEGTVPGSDAMNPKVVMSASGEQGWLWGIYKENGVTYVNHLGQTGGFSAGIVLDTTNKKAVVILSNTSVAVDAEMMALIKNQNL